MLGYLKYKNFPGGILRDIIQIASRFIGLTKLPIVGRCNPGQQTRSLPQRRLPVQPQCGRLRQQLISNIA